MWLALAQQKPDVGRCVRLPNRGGWALRKLRTSDGPCACLDIRSQVDVVNEGLEFMRSKLRETTYLGLRSPKSLLISHISRRVTRK